MLRRLRFVALAVLLVLVGTSALRVRRANERTIAAPERSQAQPPLARNACAGDSQLRLGAGKADVTPPLLGLGTGYNAPGFTLEGLAMRLYARAFVIESPCAARRVVFVSVDALHMYQSLTSGVLAKLRERHGALYGADNVMLTATHAHGAPTNLAWRNLYSFFAGVSGFDELAYDLTVDGIVRAIEEAHDGLAPGTLSLATGAVPGAVHNRSRQAYLANHDRAAHDRDVDDAMMLVRLRGEDGAELGAISWFGLHGTSLSIDNHLVHGDNKGLASYALEQRMAGQSQGFVAAFAQGVTGDVSPNAPDPRDPTARYLRPSDLDARVGELDNARLHAAAQLEVAAQLFEAAREPLGARLDYRHRYVNFEHLAVSPAYGGEPGARTCAGAVGAGIAAGTEEGSPDFLVDLTEGDLAFGKLLGALPLAPELVRCQAEKVVALPVGGDVESAWSDPLVPLQIFTIGQLALVGSSFEITTMVARRLRAQLLATLAPLGVEHVVLAEIANSYNMYVTTREEYALQHFEGTVTHYGPNTAAAYLEQLDELARALVRGQAVAPGPTPPSLSDRLTLHTPDDSHGALFDSPGMAAFGTVLAQPPARVARDLRQVTATFRSAHPRSVAVLMRAGTLSADAFSFADVQRLEADGWRTVASDGAPETELRFRRSPVLPLHDAEVSWDVRSAPPGTYRIVHRGVATQSLFGLLRRHMPFEGATRPFVIEAEPQLAGASTR
jgi:neutral ceramidase